MFMYETMVFKWEEGRSGPSFIGEKASDGVCLGYVHAYT